LDDLRLVDPAKNQQLKMGLSVVIVSYNVVDLMQKCLQSLIDQLAAEDEIWVIDNASADNTAEMITTLFPQVNLICSPQNLGFSSANNLGINKVSRPYTLLLNPDTELPAHSIRNLKNAINKYGNNYVIGAHLLNSDGSLQRSAWKYPKGLDMLAEATFLSAFINNQLSKDRFRQDMPVEALSGAALLVETNLLNELKGLDPEIFWMDDVDLCYRASLKGKPAIWVVDWEVIHHSGKSSVSASGIPLANQLISRLKFFKKHRWIFSLITGHIACLLQLGSRLILLHIGSVFSAKAVARAIAYRYATKRYLRYVLLNDRSIL
jgi:N-acetylglucosaminyl-diphospho-decaprenol L-rhamnosyltransferase